MNFFPEFYFTLSLVYIYMIPSGRRYSTEIVSRVQTLIESKRFTEISKAICGLKASTLTQSEWNAVTEAVTSFMKTNKSNTSLGYLSGSLLLGSASQGFPLSRSSRDTVSRVALESFPSLSVFDKVVFTVGSCQTGLRNASVVEFVNRFLSEEQTNGFMNVPSTILPSLILSVATLGIDNHNSWNALIAKIDVEKLSSSEVSNVALAIVTSRTFPIATVEKILDRAAEIGALNFSFNDAICILHSLCCLEVFRIDLVRGLLQRIGKEKAVMLDADGSKLLKQAILSLFLDEKAHAVVQSVSPRVLKDLNELVDWSLPEPQRHHGQEAGEIQEILSSTELGEDSNMHKAIVVPIDLADWTKEIASSVAMERFYSNDAIVEGKKIFVHFDDETYPDIREGPIDAYLQAKHMHVLRCGWRLLWVRAHEWDALSSYSEKQSFIQKLLQ